mgnify:CR=1 FL=1
MRTARRDEPRRSPNLCDNQRQDERFSPFSMRAKPSPRLRRNSLPGGAFAFSVLQFFTKSQCEQHAEKNRAALRTSAINSAKTSASARSQCAQNHRPAAGEMLSRAGRFHRLVLQFFTEKPMRTARRDEPRRSPNLRDKPITSAETSASSRSQYAQNHRPAAGETLSRAGRLHFQFYSFASVSST